MATRERTEERVERTETPADYKPRLKEQYNNELRAQLKDELDVSNVMLVCPTCRQPTRVGVKVKEIKGETVRVRVCKRDGCGQEI